MGVCAVNNYDLLRALCVHITIHATLQLQLAIRGQLKKVTVPLKLL